MAPICTTSSLSVTGPARARSVSTLGYTPTERAEGPLMKCAADDFLYRNRILITFAPTQMFFDLNPISFDDIINHQRMEVMIHERLNRQY